MHRYQNIGVSADTPDIDRYTDASAYTPDIDRYTDASADTPDIDRYTDASADTPDWYHWLKLFRAKKRRDPLVGSGRVSI